MTYQDYINTYKQKKQAARRPLMRKTYAEFIGDAATHQFDGIKGKEHLIRYYTSLVEWHRKTRKHDAETARPYHETKMRLYREAIKKLESVTC